MELIQTRYRHAHIYTSLYSHVPEKQYMCVDGAYCGPTEPFTPVSLAIVNA
jgi:hypothetical protein